MTISFIHEFLMKLVIICFFLSAVFYDAEPFTITQSQLKRLIVSKVFSFPKRTFMNHSHDDNQIDEKKQTKVNNFGTYGSASMDFSFAT
jgi:hypothetical protein